MVLGFHSRKAMGWNLAVMEQKKEMIIRFGDTCTDEICCFLNIR